MNSTTINFRIDQVSKDELQEIANEKGVKVSILVREIINGYLQEHFSKDAICHKVYLEVPSDYNPNY